MGTKRELISLLIYLSGSRILQKVWSQISKEREVNKLVNYYSTVARLTKIHSRKLTMENWI